LKYLREPSVKKLLFISVGSYIPEGRFHLEVARRLAAKGYAITLVTLARQEARELRGQGTDVILMADRLRYVRPVVAARFQQERDRIVSEYDLPSLRWLWLPDRSSEFHSPAIMERKTVEYFLAWEEIVRDVRPDYILADFGGELIRRVPRRIAQRYGIQYLDLDWSPIHQKMAIHSCELNHWDHMRVADSPLQPDEQAEVDAYLAQVHQSRLSAVNFWRPAITGTRIKRLGRELWREVVIERRRHDHFTPSLWFRKYLKRLIKRPIVKRWYSVPAEGEKYVFFPLHDASDAQISVRAPAFIRQEALVDWIARSVPYGYTVCVKEHPYFIAKYPLQMYRAIAQMPQVRLLPPYLHPHDVIQNAEATVTINSTAGFESLLFHKPVVVIGPVSYRGYGATIDVENVVDLPEKVKAALIAPPPHWKIDRLLWSMRQASYPGRLYNFDPDNITNVAESIHAKIEENGRA
jgi:hypothetical protein